MAHDSHGLLEDSTKNKTMLPLLRKRKYIYLLMVIIFTYFLYSFFSVNKEGNFFTRRTNAFDLKYVVVHLDLKGTPPSFSYLRSILPTLKKHGANGLLIEYEDMFPFKGPLAVLNARNVYNRFELRSFLIDAVQQGFEIIPLVQTFGHMEYILKHEQYKDLRENPDVTNSICPSQQRSLDLIREMLRQIITFHSTIFPLNFLHVGCDEVYELNKCQYCKQRKTKKLRIFQQHVKVITEYVKELSAETSVLIWDDMLRSNDNDSVENTMPLSVDLVCWMYQLDVHVSYVNLYKYKKNFNDIWAASAFKGADGSDSILPNLTTRFQNHFSWMKFFEKYPRLLGQKKPDFKGFILTGWSRFSHNAPVCDVLPASMPSLIMNLILINKFNTQAFDNVAAMNWSGFYEDQMKKPVHKALKCNGDPAGLSHVYEKECSYEGSDLFAALKSFRDLERSLDDEKDEKAVVRKKFDKSKKYNERCKNKISVKYNETKGKFLIMEENVAKIMSNYYDAHVIMDYLSQLRKKADIDLNSWYGGWYDKMLRKNDTEISFCS